MTFTALHRSLGLAPSQLTDDILNQAIAAAVTETDDLDWKSELPPQNGLTQTDVPKDIAAMANSGGGMIVYGVTEKEKAATGRKDTGDFTEDHERTFRRVAVTAITPPVFGLKIHRLGDNPCAVAVIVPASVDGPHLVFRGEYFGAPIRNHADTEWMKERQIETMYRARFDEQRRSTEAIDSLYAEAAAGRNTGNRAWLIAVAHPRIPGPLVRPTREQAQAIFKQAESITLSYSTRTGVHRWRASTGLTRDPACAAGSHRTQPAARARCGGSRGPACTTMGRSLWRLPLVHTRIARAATSRAERSKVEP